jgi:hypothetical protein
MSAMIAAIMKTSLELLPFLDEDGRVLTGRLRYYPIYFFICFYIGNKDTIYYSF